MFCCENRRFCAKKHRCGRIGAFLCLSQLFSRGFLEEGIDLTPEDEEHAQRSDDLHADLEETEGLHLVALLLALLLHQIGTDLPTQHQGHQQCAQRHHDTLRQHVEEVQPVSSPCACVPQTQQCCGVDAGTAQTVSADQDAADSHEAGSNQSVLLTLIALALLSSLVNEVSNDDFQQC